MIFPGTGNENRLCRYYYLLDPDGQFPGNEKITLICKEKNTKSWNEPYSSSLTKLITLNQNRQSLKQKAGISVIAGLACECDQAKKSATSYALLLLLLLNPGTQFPGNEKITLCNTEKYENQAGMNLTHPPSQNSHAVRWHCTAESERRVAEIIS